MCSHMTRISLPHRGHNCCITLCCLTTIHAINIIYTNKVCLTCLWKKQQIKQKKNKILSHRYTRFYFRPTVSIQTHKYHNCSSVKQFYPYGKRQLCINFRSYLHAIIVDKREICCPQIVSSNYCT